MRKYLILINWVDGAGTEVEVMARNKSDALKLAVETLDERVRCFVHTYVLLKTYRVGDGQIVK